MFGVEILHLICGWGQDMGFLGDYPKHQGIVPLMTKWRGDGHSMKNWMVPRCMVHQFVVQVYMHMGVEGRVPQTVAVGDKKNY